MNSWWAAYALGVATGLLWLLGPLAVFCIAVTVRDRRATNRVLQGRRS